MTTSIVRSALLTTALATLASVPALAQAYIVTLTNGTTFETRYQPRPTPWDSDKVMFMSEVGNLVSIPEADIASIEPLIDLRGFGRVIDTTTIELGMAPNDLTDEDIERRLTLPALPPQRFDMDQFVEPDETGGGMPVWGGGGGGQGPQIPGAPLIPPIPQQQPTPAPVPPQN